MNKYNFSSLWMALGMLALVVALFVGVSVSRANQTSNAVESAVVFLKTQPDDATKTMALVAVGESPDVSYLESFSASTAIEYAKPILAIASIGKNPAVYANEDLVAKLKSFADATQLGSASQINDDIWGILALRAAGVAHSDSVIQNSKAFVLGNQNANGGWAWNVGGDSDTNDTAVAIMALLEAGMNSSDSAITKAIAYIRSAQNEDGGFPYDPQSIFGTDSDGNSSAWVIAVANKLGEDAKNWTKDGKNPVEYLLTLQDTDGGFWWMAPPADFNNKGPTADAVIALVGKSYPVAVFSNGGGGLSDTEVFYRIVGSNGQMCKASGSIANALQVIIHGASECNFTYDIKDTSFGPYLAAIDNDIAVGSKGWMYLVNGQSPSIGAADYALSGGEHVLWFFDEFDADPPIEGTISKSVDLLVEIIDGSGDGTPGGGGGSDKPEIGFSVRPSLLEFGQLLAGSSAANNLQLTNEGQKNISVTVEVQGDSVFNFVKLAGDIWSAFKTQLIADEDENVTVQLSVPAGFSSFGQKQGSLIFWAEAQN